MLKSDPTMKALLWLAEYGKEVDNDAERSDGAIDYDRIVQLMQNVLNIHLVNVVNLLTHTVHTICNRFTKEKDPE